MSDSTANAREPSMEDILASIRRIIDEEDTRDARPASDMAVDDAQDGDVGAPPVMAAAPVGRDDAMRGAADDGGDDGQAEAIFPERESLFWSRATGRGDAPATHDDARGEVPAGPRTDIFRRAQNKLGSSTRLGARERIQSLAARAEERAGSAAHERGSLTELEDLSDRVDADRAQADDARNDGADAVEDASTAAAAFDAAHPREDVSENAAADAYPDLDASDVLDLTEPLDNDEPSGDDDVSRFAGLSDDEDRMDLSRDNAIGEPADRDPEALDGMFAVGEEATAHDGDREDDDVLDLTTPVTETPPVEEAEAVEEGSVENGDSFHVSDVAATGQEPQDDAEPDIEDAITRNLEAYDEVEAQDDAPEEDAPEEEERAHHDASLNTYSRFDGEPEDMAVEPDEPDGFANEDDAIAFTLADHAGTDEGPVHASTMEDDEADRVMAASVADGHADFDDIPADEPPVEDAATAADDDRSAAALTDEDAAAPLDDSEPADDTYASAPAPDAYAAAFTMLDDQPSGRDRPESLADGLDDLDLGDELGFSDTFSASDVYHDDPPTLDDDYSRSFEVEDEPVAARAGHRDDAPDEAGGPPDRNMEKVGGLVRDAMERDPVDYADPSALVSMTSEEISARALASLADVEGEASRRMFGSLRISDDDGSESLEGMVRGMLRPLLREWLDDNLPTMVESAVRGEVERISAKSRRYSRAADED